MDATDSVSRRRPADHFWLGQASAASGRTLPQQSDQSSGSGGELAADDPRTKYPKPPFKEQTQPWPGLANKMDPKPDHGETNYHGSGAWRGAKR